MKGCGKWPCPLQYSNTVILINHSSFLLPKIRFLPYFNLAFTLQRLPSLSPSQGLFFLSVLPSLTLSPFCPFFLAIGITQHHPSKPLYSILHLFVVTERRPYHERMLSESELSFSFCFSAVFAFSWWPALCHSTKSGVCQFLRKRLESAFVISQNIYRI